MKETESIQTVDTNIKIPFWKAACFGLGDFGNNFVWTFVGSYLMIWDPNGGCLLADADCTGMGRDQ